tara:strand:+ start:2646 stop:2939 length:294 start_codon:yes stop_codon:yes gene_type:complete
MQQIPARVDNLILPQEEYLKEKGKTHYINVDDDFIEELNAYCHDSIVNFDCLPVEFEYNGLICDYDDFLPFIKEEYKKEFSDDEINSMHDHQERFPE